MAANQKDQSHVAAIIERFKSGALLADQGCEDNDDDVHVEGLDIIRQSLGALDALGPHGRDALMPVLDDPVAAIRVYAAAALVRIVPDRALAVLNDIRDRCLTEARMTASRLLILYEHGGLNL